MTELEEQYLRDWLMLQITTQVLLERGEPVNISCAGPYPKEVSDNA